MPEGLDMLVNLDRSAGRGLSVERVGEMTVPGGGGAAVQYRVGECTVIQSDRRHFSISHTSRDPTWEEIAAARYALLPRLRDCALLLPPDEDYVNVHEHCFHVHLLRELAPGGRFHSPEAW